MKNKKVARTDEYAKILDLCKQIHEESPELRFGQVISNAVRISTGIINCDPFHISDEELLWGMEGLEELK